MDKFAAFLTNLDNNKLLSMVGIWEDSSTEDLLLTDEIYRRFEYARANGNVAEENRLGSVLARLIKI